MKARGCTLDLLGHSLTTRLFIPRSICAQSLYSWSLSSWCWMCWMLPMSMPRSLVEAMVLIVLGDMLK